MAADAVWGLDIGQCALKAVKARLSGALIQVLAFDHIDYRTPMGAGADSSVAIREALQTFLSRNEVENCDFAVSIAAGRSALIRFIKLPPVDRRKVPDIVRYEATQQIPFPLEDVVWDYQVIEREYGPGEELEVGIFAMRREAIFNFLSNLMVSGVEVGSIQLAAAAVYNCVRYDQAVEDGAIMAVDIGAENTNLVVVDGESVWTRSLPIGGNDFTRAIATKYGLEFEQAETLKRSMERSKKAQEIFEALRPSLRSLLDEIQRSAGYYRSLHKSAKFVKLIGFGSGFKMYGVKRFLEAGLAYPTVMYGQTNNIMVDGALNLQFFRKSAPAFGAAFGLAVQALGYGGINTNLMPPQILKERMLKSKRPVLVGAAAMLAGACVFYAAMPFLQPRAYPLNQDPTVRAIETTISDLEDFENKTNVVEVAGEIDQHIRTKASRTEALDVFNALLASLPVDKTYPIYIDRMAMVKGNAQRLEAKLRKSPAGEAGVTSSIGSDSVGELDFIKDAKEAAVTSSRTRSVAAMTADERSQMREDRLEERMRAMDEAEEARHARALAGREAGGGRSRQAVAAEDVERAGKVLKFRDTGYLVEITVETARPEGAGYIPKLCAHMKAAVPGVVYCNYWYADTEDYWEHEETHARQLTEQSGPAAEEYVRKKYAVAVIQWVYAPAAAARASAER